MVFIPWRTALFALAKGYKSLVRTLIRNGNEGLWCSISGPLAWGAVLFVKAVSMANLFSISICKLLAKLSEQVSLASAYRRGELISLRSYKSSPDFSRAQNSRL